MSEWLEIRKENERLKAELDSALRVVEAARGWAHQPEGMSRSGMRVDELPENALYLATLEWEKSLTSGHE